jgi:hypothetical protein
LHLLHSVRTLGRVKKSRRVNFRIDPETFDQFCEAARRVDVNRSRAIRELLRAATEYMDRLGAWYPPIIAPAPPPLDERTTPFAYPAQREVVAHVVADLRRGQRVQGVTERPRSRPAQ